MRDRTVAAALVLLLGGALVEACSSFAVTDGPATDAGAADASSTPVSPLAEGGAETGAAAPFCMAHGATFDLCSDFDDPTSSNPLQGWTRSEVGGTMQVVTYNSFSPSGSLRAVLNGTSTSSARLLHTLPSDAKRVRLSLQVNLGQITLLDKQDVAIAEIYCNSNGSNEGAYIFVEGPRLDVFAYSGGNSAIKTALPPLTPAGWTSIVIDAAFDQATPGASISINGAVPTNVEITPACAHALTFDVRAGLATSSSAHAEAFLDNVRYELDPHGL